MITVIAAVGGAVLQEMATSQMAAGKAPDSLRFNPQIKAFMRMIRDGESSQGQDAYFVINGGKLYKKANGFTADLITIPHPNFKGKYSTASGAYQVVYETWREMSRKRGLGDNAVMSPANQEKVALALLERRRAVDAVLRGDIDAAIKKIPNEWAAFKPAEMLKQNKTVEHYKRVFVQYGGKLAAG